MKTEDVKSIEHESGYLTFVTVTVVMLVLLIFPLFIILLPPAILFGASDIWKMDHGDQKRIGANL